MIGILWHIFTLPGSMTLHLVVWRGLSVCRNHRHSAAQIYRLSHCWPWHGKIGVELVPLEGSKMGSMLSPGDSSRAAVMRHSLL